VVALLLTLVLGACSSGGGKKAAGAPSTQKKAAAVKVASLKLGAVAVQSAGPPVGLDSATRAAALAVAQKYVDTAVNGPLNDGAVGAGYDTIFDTGVRPVATTTDAPALTETGIGKLDSYTQTSTPVAVSGLADNTGALLYLATNFSVQVKAKIATGPLKLTRTVELTLVPDAAKHWSVSAYRVVAVRATPTATTTTTAKSGGTTP
jgi:hypothetical protein